ncbi:glutathione S-transferase C-terminal-like protein [Rickenella mellea]|uniref:Glutathione S-transferase C-terminal-like protein n=1 Tax=Rickenella mellea TaxID=50990 RepID=A0A4Y7QIU5_9AGAM|nr:glutathione S-transferase C-terminal-like protein [Rickenella mellea]
MTSIGKLWTVSYQPTGRRIRAIVAFADLSVEIPDNFKFPGDNRSPEFTAKFLSGKIPAFEDNDGFCLFETTAIAEYVASLAPKSGLIGTSPKELAVIHQWVSFADAEIARFTGLIAQMLNGIVPYHKDIHAKLTENQIRSFDTLEKHLSNRTFLVSDKITLADITMVSVLSSALYFTLDATLRKKYPSIVQFYERVIDHPKIKDLNWTREYVEKAKEYVPKE